MFWQFWSNIYWNILGKLPLKILVTSHIKSSRTVCTKFLEIFRSRSKNFWTNTSTTMQKCFPKDYRKCCVNIPTIIARKVSETFLKYFVYGLDRGHKHSTKCSGKFAATFIEIFHASFLLRYLKYCTKSCRNFSEKFREIFKSRSQTFSTNISTTGQKYFPKDYKKCCVNIPTIIGWKVSETFPKYLVYGLEENTNILRNVLAILELHLLKYSRQASFEDTCNLTHKI